MNIKTIRTKNQMTQTEVAVATGVSLTTYQLWERGVSKPTEENKKKLYKALGIKEGE